MNKSKKPRKTIPLTAKIVTKAFNYLKHYPPGGINLYCIENNLNPTELGIALKAKGFKPYRFIYKGPRTSRELTPAVVKEAIKALSKYPKNGVVKYCLDNNLNPTELCKVLQKKGFIFNNSGHHGLVIELMASQLDKSAKIGK
jgi:hypothetical protein